MFDQINYLIQDFESHSPRDQNPIIKTIWKCKPIERQQWPVVKQAVNKKPRKEQAGFFDVQDLLGGL